MTAVPQLGNARASDPLPSQETLRIARTIIAASWIGVTAALAWTLGCWLLLPPDLRHHALSALILSTSIATLLLAHRGHVRAAGWIVSAGTWATIVLVTLGAGSVGPETIGAVAIGIVITGLVVGGAGVLAYGVLLAATLVALDLGFDRGWIEQRPIAPYTALERWPTNLLIVATLVAFVFEGHRHIRAAIEDAMRTQEHLAGTNRSLREEIESRIRAVQALHTTERRYRALFELSPVGVATFDTNLVCTSANDSLAQMLGAPSPEAIVGQSLPDLSGTAKSGAPTTLHRMLAARDLFTLEHSFHTGWGKAVRMHAHVKVIRDEEGRIAWVQIAAEDVAEHRQLEEQLRQSQKMQAVGVLAGGVAHEFNNYLTVILGHAELLALQLSEDQPQRETIEQIRRAAERSAALTHALLAVGQRQVLRPTALDPNDLVLRSEDLLRRLLGDRIAIEIATGSEMGSVRADPRQIEQVLLSLAANARDAMPDGGTLTLRTQTVEIGPEDAAALGLDPGLYAAIDVSDTGYGLEPDVQARIFEPFFSTKHGARREGLGLATAYGIVKQSGGHISVSSAPGSGTDFRILLPCTEGSTSHARPEPPRAQPEPSAATILVAEDNEMVRRVTRSVLESAGYRVLAADRGASAVELFEQHADEIDLLLTDVLMPAMTGPELASRLIRKRPGLRVLFMSGYTTRPGDAGGTAIPASHLLQKPFNREDLLERVRRALTDTLDEISPVDPPTERTREL